MNNIGKLLFEGTLALAEWMNVDFLEAFIIVALGMCYILLASLAIMEAIVKKYKFNLILFFLKSLWRVVRFNGLLAKSLYNLCNSFSKKLESLIKHYQSLK